MTLLKCMQYATPLQLLATLDSRFHLLTRHTLLFFCKLLCILCNLRYYYVIFLSYCVSRYLKLKIFIQIIGLILNQKFQIGLKSSLVSTLIFTHNFNFILMSDQKQSQILICYTYLLREMATTK